MGDLSKHLHISAVKRCFLALTVLQDGHQRGRAALDDAIAMLEGAECLAAHPTQLELKALTVARESARRLRAIRSAPPLSFQHPQGGSR